MVAALEFGLEESSRAADKYLKGSAGRSGSSCSPGYWRKSVSEESPSGKGCSESAVAAEAGGGQTLPHPQDYSDRIPGHRRSLSFPHAERHSNCALTQMLKLKRNLA